MLYAIPLRPLSTETTGELEVLRLDSDTLSVDSSQVGVLKEGDEVGLGCLLKSHNGGRLESEVGLEGGWGLVQCKAKKLEPRLTLKSCAISRTSLWKGSFRIRSSVDLKTLVSIQITHAKNTPPTSGTS